MIHTLLTLILATPLHDARVSDMVALVSQETGEPEALIATVINAESARHREAVRYCLRWETDTNGLLYCPNDRQHQASCYSRCRRNPKVWARKLNVSSECLLDPLCSSLAAAEIIRRYKALPPKKCGLRGVPDAVGSWVAYYTGGMRKRAGCRARKERLEKAGLTQQPARR